MRTRALVTALLLAGCGARSGVATSSADSGSGPGGSAGGSTSSAGPVAASSASSSGGGTGGASACSGTLTFSSSINLDVTDDENPSSVSPILVWTGTSLLVVTTHDVLPPSIEVEPVQVSNTGITEGVPSMLPAGSVSPLYGAVAAWDGTSAALAWPQLDGSIVMQHVDPSGAAIDAITTVVPAMVPPCDAGICPLGSTYLDQLLPVPTGYLLAYSTAPPSQMEAQNWVAALSQQGVPLAAPTLLSTGTRTQFGASLAALDDRVYAVWTTDDASIVGTSTLASLDPQTGAVQTSVVFDTGQGDAAWGLVVEPTHHRLDVPVAQGSSSSFAIYRGSGTALAALPVMDPSNNLTLAVDPCAGLLALSAVDGASALALQRVADDGSFGPAVTWPATSPFIFFADIVAVPGGLVVGWADGDQAPTAPEAHLTFVAVE
jgi:hypothetical protein